MTNKAFCILAAIVALSIGATAAAEHVRGYTRKDGTYVYP
jgi:uncharacterized membrane protein